MGGLCYSYCSLYHFATTDKIYSLLKLFVNFGVRKFEDALVTSRIIPRVFLGVLIFEMVIFPCRFHGCLQVKKCFEKNCLQTSNCLKAYSEGEIFNITSIYYIHSNRNFMIYKKKPIVVKMERSIVANLLLASIMSAQWKLLNYVQ